VNVHIGVYKEVWLIDVSDFRVLVIVASTVLLFSTNLFSFTLNSSLWRTEKNNRASVWIAVHSTAEI
jgi:hypothetical protein